MPSTPIDCLPIWDATVISGSGVLSPLHPKIILRGRKRISFNLARNSYALLAPPKPPQVRQTPTRNAKKLFRRAVRKVSLLSKGKEGVGWNFGSSGVLLTCAMKGRRHRPQLTSQGDANLITFYTDAVIMLWTVASRLRNLWAFFQSPSVSSQVQSEKLSRYRFLIKNSKKKKKKGRLEHKIKNPSFSTKKSLYFFEKLLPVNIFFANNWFYTKNFENC